MAQFVVPERTSTRFAADERSVENKQTTKSIMIKHIISLAAVVSALMVMTTLALAGEPKAFDQEAFMKARAEGKTVAIAFHADWCAVCKKQAAVIPLVLKEDKFQKVVAFTADYDKEKELKEQLKVSGQSTLVVFKGEREVGREQGITAAAAIENLLTKGL